MSQKHYNFENLRVLVVDDCQFMCKVLERMLAVFGFKNVMTARNGYDALHETNEFNPDIIICDWEMSPMNGPDFVKKLRNSSDTKKPFIPVIMLTGYTEQSRVTAARDFGITEFVAKPVAARTLYARIVACIERPRPYVRSQKFFGPDRRRTKTEHKGAERRVKQKAANNWDK